MPSLPRTPLLPAALALLLTLAAAEHTLVSLPLHDTAAAPPLPLARFPKFGPVAGTECGYARVTHVGVSVNKGASATLRYKLKVTAIASEELAYRDHPFLNALSEPLKASYLKLRNEYDGGLGVPFLRFLGVDLGKPGGRGRRDKKIADREYARLARIAEKIMRDANKTVIVVKGRLKATGITCMRTTAYAFIKVAKVKMTGGGKLTVVTSKGDGAIAATKHADTTLPSKGEFDILNF